MQPLTQISPTQYELEEDGVVWVVSHDVSVLISEGPHDLTIEVFRTGHENSKPIDTTSVHYKRKGAYAP